LNEKDDSAHYILGEAAHDADNEDMVVVSVVAMVDVAVYRLKGEVRKERKTRDLGRVCLTILPHQPHSYPIQQSLASRYLSCTTAWTDWYLVSYQYPDISSP
jgi:hypothetical protein